MTYTYQITVSNTSGPGTPSNQVTQLSLPSQPAGLNAVAPTTGSPQHLGASEVDLSWTDTSANPVPFNVERSTDNKTFTVLTPMPLPAGTTSYKDTTVQPNTQYYYRYRASMPPGRALTPPWPRRRRSSSGPPRRPA